LTRFQTLSKFTDTSIFEKALRNIYSKKVNVKTEIEPNLFDITFKQLNLAVDESFADVKFGEPDYDFIQELKYNNAVFSAFKTHRQQNDLAKQLINDKGNMKSFSDFKKDTETIIGKYNVDWLNTEYNTAVLRARQASNFKKFERDKDLYPNLKWLPSTSVEIRKVHEPFYNKVWAIDDKFWAINFPGNLWNCKCDVTNTDEKISNQTFQNGQTNKADKGLEGNPAFTKQIFNIKNHSYATNGYEKFEVINKIANDIVTIETLRTQRIEILENAKKILKDKFAVHSKIEGKIYFSNRYIKEAINQPHNNILEKNKAILNIIDLIKKSKYIDFVLDTKNRCEGFYYLETNIKEEKSYIILRKEFTGEIKFYTITDKMKK